MFETNDILYGKLRPYLKNWLHPNFNGIALGDFWVLQARNCDSKFLFSLVHRQNFKELQMIHLEQRCHVLIGRQFHKQSLVFLLLMKNNPLSDPFSAPSTTFCLATGQSSQLPISQGDHALQDVSQSWTDST